MAIDDPLLAAFDALEVALAENERRGAAMRERMAWIRARRAEGTGYREIVPAERPPLIVELLSDSAHDLEAAGARVRRAEARALHDEGMTMEAIAGHFRVSRQRVSVLLRRPGAD
jgi:DNA invertase Pin-like site-specific DNA recombinase